MQSNLAARYHISDRKRTIRGVLSLILRPEKSFYALAMIYSVAIGLMTLAVPVSVQALINTVMNTAILQFIIVLTLILFSILFVSVFLTALREYTLELFQRRFFVRITSEIAGRLVYADKSDFKGIKYNDMINRFFEIMHVQKNMPVLCTNGFALILQTIVGLVVVSFYHPFLFGYNLVLLALIVATWRFWSARATIAALDLSDSKYDVVGWLEDLAAQDLGGDVEKIKSHLSQTDQQNAAYIRKKEALFGLTFAQLLAFLALYCIASAALLGLGGYLVARGQLTLGQLVGAELIMSAIFYGISRLGYYAKIYYELCASVNKLSYFFDIPLPDSAYIHDETILDDPFVRDRLPTYKSQSTPKPLRAAALMVSGMIVATSIFLAVVPWAQTASGEGQVTTMSPSDRPQAITALVAGRIKQWHVREGDKVKAGEPIVEIVDNDPRFIERLDAERNAAMQKLDAARLAADTAKIDYDRQEKLYKDGLSARKDVEKARILYQEYVSKEVSAVAELAQVENKRSRQNSQLVTAPADGMIVNIKSGDMSTFVKEGDALATFIPQKGSTAVEIFVRGVDAPLIQAGAKVRLQFEGWPAVQFSGWPSVSVGTFGGIVETIDSAASANGKFRVLVRPDPEDPWPSQNFLRFGGRAKGWVMLNTVSIGYELWRQMNSFPPEYPQGSKTYEFFYDAQKAATREDGR